MSSPSKLEDARDEVLRKLGRNVVNFQKMEGMLKLLNSQNHLSGALSDIQRLQAKASKTVAREPMGRLADAFIKSIYSADLPNIEPQGDSRNASISFSFRMDAAPEVARERKRALSAVVSERNKLIHRWLVHFDPNSVASCVELGSKLDEQHAKIWPEFEILRSMVLALREHREELRRYVASDEFLAELRRGESSA
jgi:hypothetical protein